MSKRTIYLETEDIKLINKTSLELFKQKKGDAYELVSFSRIFKVTEDCRRKRGGFYDKAVVLLKGIVNSHAFASGNRRTACLAILVFCYINKRKVYIPNSLFNSRVFIGIREDYYSDNELKAWIKNGKIRKFKRE